VSLNRQSWQFWKQGVGDDFIETVEKSAKNILPMPATTFGGEQTNQNRRSEIKWLSNNRDLRLALSAYIQEANKAFDIDVTSQCEIQYTEYGAGGDFYALHHDIDWNSNHSYDRKISMSILLSDPKDFDGGELTFSEITNEGIDWQKGSVLCFPSYLQHSVSPVTRGTRKSLVAWFSGPRWR
jgi:PKHD-type hydroxylase